LSYQRHIAVAGHALTQKSKGHMVTKTITVAWLLWLLCYCCRHGTAHYMTAFVSSFWCDAGVIVEAVCWSDTVCIYMHTRPPGLDITTVLGGGILQWRSGGNTSTLPPTLWVSQL